MKKLLAVLVGLALAGGVVYADLNARARTTFVDMFDSSGYPGIKAYAADPFTCDSTHLPTATRPAIQYWNTVALEFRVCDGTAWRTGALIGSAGSAESVTTGDILDGTIANADIATGADIARSKLAEDALQAYPVDLKTVTFTSLAGAEAAGTFNEKVATNVLKLQGEVTDNETEVSVGYFRYILPPSYVAAGDVVVRFRSALVASGSPVNNGSTLDLECYKQADAAVGSDLVATAAVTFAALDTYYSKDFTVTATTLVAGDILSCKVTTSIVDSEAGAGTIIWTSDPIKVLLDVKG